MKKIVLIGLLLCLCSCGSQLYIPTESKANISVENLQEGRKIYVNNCASCHQLYAPNKYKSGDWQKKLDAFLRLNDYSVLEHPGTLKAEVAKALAEKEFDKFRLTQDRAYISDFDQLVEDATKLGTSFPK